MIILLPLFILGALPLLIIPLAWWSIEYGVIAIVVILPAYLLRTSAYNIPTTPLELSIYGLVIGAILHWVLRGGWRRLSIPRIPLIVLLSWICAWIIAVVFSTDRTASLGAFKAWLIDPLLFGFLLWSAITTRKKITHLFTAVATSGVIVSLAGLIQLAFYPATVQDGRLSSFFYPVANYAAMYLGPILVVTLGALLWKMISRWWWVGAGIISIALVLTVSFGGYLAVGAAVLFLWWKWPAKRLKWYVLIGMALVAIVGILFLSQTRYFSEKFKNTDRSSSLVRSQIWRTSVEMIREHPLVGIGPNAYEKVYRQTVPKLYYPPLEWLVSQPHQLYLALWLETGLLGLVVFLVFTAFWFHKLWSRIRTGEPLASIASAAMITMLVHGFVDTPVFKNDLMLMFVFVVLVPFLRSE